MIELRLLGEIRLRASSGADVEALLRQPKRLALLAYLAAPAPGTWHRRDMLLALFWPELDTAHARTSLRNALYVLRQTLGDRVIRTRGDEEISIDPAEMNTDLAAVWAALRSGRSDEALASYGGDLLPGLFPADSDGFQRWLETERTRLKVAVCSTAITQLDQLEREGKLSEALAVARKLIEVQPDDETIVRRLMTLHEAMGDRAGALAVFEGYRSRLASDFDAEPAPETVAIADRLRALAPAVAPRARPGGNGRPNIRRSVEPMTSSNEVDAASAPPRTQGRPFTLPSVALVIVAVLAIAAWSLSRSSRPLAVGASSPLTGDEGLQVEAAISPNGRLVAYAKGNSNRLRVFVQKIGGGTAWPLTEDSTAFELLPRWSPDNDELLFLSRNNAYVSPSIGGAPRLVARGSNGDGMVRSASWSPLGDSLAIVRNDSLTVRPLQGPGSRYVGTGNQLHSCVWSPDALWIACVSGNLVALQAGPLFGNEAPSAILNFPAAGGASIDLTGHEFQHRSPSWSADGHFLWILSNRDGAPGEAYAIPIGKDGHQAGAFVRIGLTAESIDLSARRMAYSVPVRRANIWSVPVPGPKLLTLSDAKRVTSGTQLIELVYASDDGNWLIYDSNLYGNADLFRVPVAGGAAERLTQDPRPEYAGTLSPDGRELAWQRWLKGERHLFVKPLDSDSETEIVPVPGDQGVPKWSPDGESLAAWSHNKEEGALFVVHRNARGEWERPAWRLEGGQLPVWSPDARTLAFIRYDGSIETIPADSGARRTVYRPRPGGDDPIASHVVWRIHPDTIWFIGSNSRAHGGIWSVPASGGTARLRVSFDDSSGRFHGPSLTTDGKRFYFTLDERFSNVRWAALLKR
jgi:DNA-binding SARP family transcriptional activator/Tol biopolymer transport system component